MSGSLCVISTDQTWTGLTPYIHSPGAGRPRQRANNPVQRLGADGGRGSGVVALLAVVDLALEQAGVLKKGFADGSGDG